MQRKATGHARARQEKAGTVAGGRGRGERGGLTELSNGDKNATSFSVAARGRGVLKASKEGFWLEVVVTRILRARVLDSALRPTGVPLALPKNCDSRFTCPRFATKREGRVGVRNVMYV